MDPRQVLGAALQHLQAGRLSASRTLCERVLETLPGHPEALHLLGVVAMQTGDPGKAAALFREAIGGRGDRADYHANLGMALRAAGRSEEAVASYERALQLDPGHANALYNLGSVRRAEGRREEAIALLERSLEAATHAIEVRTNLAALLLEGGLAEAALHQCTVCLEHRPKDRLAIGYKAIALQTLGRREEARYLLDLERLVRTETIRPPDGYADLEQLNDALARHIEGHPTLSPEQASRATRNGMQTGSLLAEPKGPFAVFELMINRAVGHYLESLPKDDRHPYLATYPNRWHLDVWGVVLHSAGHQATHMHPGGWVSGVYYVELPGEVTDNGPDGWIEFGRPPPELGSVPESEVMVIRPEAGKLVLFPSYVFHRTIPFASRRRRISVAFDAIPAG